ncbi:hypothetical protein [Micromonospora echinofusca]|uniref:NurA domain-containing protein n=1 Tax=Micromonospora echinofusca TaxID=47858 RepID=A0ABS3VRN6_MICEH|nr:hypothetical protein [Micromonospora echinofusca]MBO4207171.1 hypothetical protein [Micromonospora echinofusca]
MTDETQLFVDSWDPSFGASFEAAGGGPATPSSTPVDPSVEIPAAEWRPVDPAPGVPAPEVVLLVDGVRRIDASLWTAEPDGASYPGVAASYAAGVVRCDLGRGAAALAGARVGRGLFTASPSAGDVVAGQIRYPVHRVGGTGELARLQAAVQGPLTELEVAVSGAARTDGDLLVVDGPLRNRRRLPRAIGYIKTQHSQYLDARLTSVVTRMASGQRSPVFALRTSWGGWSWYLRLPVSTGAPWAGIVRVECSPDLTAEEAIGLADLSLVTLPRFASSPYKDPRAPQNLVPIAGLERRLRAMLGDGRLLHRVLTSTVRRGGRR